VVDSSDGGQAYENPKTRLRTLQCTLPKMTALEAYGSNDNGTTGDDVASIQDMQLSAGTTGEVLIFPRTSSLFWMRRLGIHGKCSEVPSIRAARGNLFATDFRVVEER
jgi:hypothetical protein